MSLGTGVGDLSLSGSQISTPVSSARRPGSAKRPSNGSGVRPKTQTPLTPSTPKGKMKRSGSSGQLSQRSDVSAAGDASKKPSARDDVMAFFESNPVQPKIKKPQQKNKTHKPAWASSSSARSTSTVDSARSDRPSRGPSRRPAGTSQAPPHSVFPPASARSNSSTGDEDEFNALMTRISQTQQDLEIESVSGFSTHRHPNSEAGATNQHSADQQLPSATSARQRQDSFESVGKNSNNLPSSDRSLRTRNLSHGENDLSLKSPDDILTEKATKLNSIANNMTSQGMSGAKTKTPLENSVQNIKHKTPVNQVNDSVRGGANGGQGPTIKRQDSRSNKAVAQDLAKRRDMAATIIQRWFRRHRCRSKAGEAALRRLLDNKKHEIEAGRQREVTESVDLEEGRRRVREERARAARQEAIQELQRKREEKRLENKRLAEEEIKFLQATGKVGKNPAFKSNMQGATKKKGPALKKPSRRDTDSDESPRRPSPSSSRRQTPRRLGETGGVQQDVFRETGTIIKELQACVEIPDEKYWVCDISLEFFTTDIYILASVEKTQHPPPTVNGFHGDSPPDHQAASASLPGGESGVPEPGSPTPSSQTGTKTTIDDLMATLKKLEEEDTLVKFSAREAANRNQKPLAWLDDLEKPEGESKDAYLTSEKLEKLDKDNLSRSGVMIDEKLKNIITYLDEVETAERLSQIDQLSEANDALINPALLLPSGEELAHLEQASANAAEDLTRANDALEKPALLLPSGEELAELEQASAYAAEVTSTVLTQKMELEEKKRTVGILQKALNQQRELTVRHARETEKEMKRRLDIQKDEYEETIKRHLSFIDQLIDDKKNLGEKCESVVKELKQVDRKYADRIKSMQENHEIELRKLKEVQAAAEKLRRERWIEEKTKKIKETTVKGLEPEIQRLIAKHKSEVKKLRSVQEAELLASDERAGQKYIQMTEELRDQLAQEKESACARERELARQTYEKQMQQEEEAYQQQRRRLYAEVQEEKDRIASSASRQRAELDRLQRQLEDQHGNSVEAMRREYDKAREEQEKRHEAETKQLKEKLALEKTSWEENYMKKQEAWAMQKERELKDSVRKERDKEIELVITRLEADNQNARDECERVADNRIKRIRDKYEAEMSELERSERQTMEKYNHTKAKLAELEGENERMKVTLRQKDKEIIELKKLLEKLNEERSHVSDVIRQEFADKLVATEEESKRIKHQMSELKARHNIELERSKAEIEVVNKAKEEEMEEVHKRVKQAIVKKEEVVTQLRQQHQAAVKRADHLEGLLEQQRKQLLGRK